MAHYAVIGLGSIGRRHLRNLRSLCPSDTLTVCRTSSRSRDCEELGLADNCIYSLEELINRRPLAAIIATPAATHLSIATMLTNVGVHVLIEKPLSNSSDGVQSLVDAVNKFGTVAIVGYNLRFSHGLRLIHRLLLESQIGRVLSAQAAVGQYLPDWRKDSDYRNSPSALKSMGGGALLELSHEIDYMNWLFGVPHRVVAFGRTSGILDVDVEDQVSIITSGNSSEPLLSIQLDMLDRAGQRKLRIVGEHGSIVWNGLTDEVRVFKAIDREWKVFEGASDRNLMYIELIKHFLNCLSQGVRPLIELSDGLNVLSVIDAVRRSIQNGTITTVTGPNNG